MCVFGVIWVDIFLHLDCIRRDNSIGMRENVDQNISEYGHFSRSEPPGGSYDLQMIMTERWSVASLISIGWRAKQHQRLISRDIECNYTQIGDKYCLCWSFKLKWIYVYWCEGNCGISTEESDENESGYTENDSDENNTTTVRKI